MIVLLAICLTLSCLVQCQTQEKPKKDLELEEDRRFLRESVTKFGPPQRPALYSLPGPEVELNDKVFKKNEFVGNEGNFTYRYRQKSDHFTYNGRYEVTRTKKINGKEILMVRGQVTEKFPRKFGGSYIRTIGYTFDENGFRTFLIDVSKVDGKRNILAGIPKPVIARYSDKIQNRGPIFSRSTFSSLSNGGLG